jgi:hypothetical protein
MLSMAFFRTIPEYMTLMVSQKVGKAVTPAKAVPPPAGWIPAFARMTKMGPKGLFTNLSNMVTSIVGL